MERILILSNSEPKKYVIGQNSGKQYELTERMYGCLDVSGNTPLSAVCVTGNSFSIDPWTGCSYQCAYCHVQGVKEDLDENGKMRFVPQRRTGFDDESICEALSKYPLFEKDESIISIGTSSTEPFAVGKVLHSTLSIMEWFVDKGYKNPFWIVTKAGIPNNAIKGIKEIARSNKVIISMCYGNNDYKIEPVKNDRFLNIDKFQDDDNVIINWYFRPLVLEWNNDQFNFEKIFKEVSEKYGKYIKAIVPGGLRWTEGIEYGVKEIRGIELPAGISKATRHEKSLKITDFERINMAAKKYFKDVPVFNHSACMISYFLCKNNIAMIEQRYSEECKMSICPYEQRSRCNTRVSLNIEKINKILKNKGLDIVFEKAWNNSFNEINSIPEINNYSPAIRQRIVYYLSTCMEEE